MIGTVQEGNSFVKRVCQEPLHEVGAIFFGRIQATRLFVRMKISLLAHSNHYVPVERINNDSFAITERLRCQLTVMWPSSGVLIFRSFSQKGRPLVSTEQYGRCCFRQTAGRTLPKIFAHALSSHYISRGRRQLNASARELLQQSTKGAICKQSKYCNNTSIVDIGGRQHSIRFDSLFVDGSATSWRLLCFSKDDRPEEQEGNVRG